MNIMNIRDAVKKMIQCGNKKELSKCRLELVSHDWTPYEKKIIEEIYGNLIILIQNEDGI